MNILNGKELSTLLEAKLQTEVVKDNLQPKLVIIQVGDDYASSVYVKNKIKAGERCNIDVKHVKLNDTIPEYQLMSIIESYNKNKDVDGILVQLPLPKHINESKILQVIDPQKDVDGFSPTNVGKLIQGKQLFVPCTPYGIMRLLECNHINLTGKNVVVVGRSNIVGKPLIPLLLEKNATVTIAHSKTVHLQDLTRRADIIIIAVGKPKFLTKDYIGENKPYIIDVGINRDENNKIVGDVDFDNVKDLCKGITPVPKGVGPMTIYALMEQTIKAHKINKQRGAYGYQYGTSKIYL